MPRFILHTFFFLSFLFLIPSFCMRAPDHRVILNQHALSARQLSSIKHACMCCTRLHLHWCDRFIASEPLIRRAPKPRFCVYAVGKFMCALVCSVTIKWILIALVWKQLSAIENIWEKFKKYSSFAHRSSKQVLARRNQYSRQTGSHHQHSLPMRANRLLQRSATQRRRVRNNNCYHLRICATRKIYTPLPYKSVHSCSSEETLDENCHKVPGDRRLTYPACCPRFECVDTNSNEIS